MASSKPTGVHFSLVFFVMATLILGIVFYVNYKELKTVQAQLATAQDEANQKQSDFTNAFDDVQALKSLMGYEGIDAVGRDATNEASVYGAMVKDLRQFGREQVQPNPDSPSVRETLQALASQLDTFKEESKTYNQGMQDAKAQSLQQQQATLGREQQLIDSKDQSEQDLQKLVTDHTEQMQQKDQEISNIRQELAQVRLESDQKSDELERVRREMTQEIQNLEQANVELRIRLEALENLSFDKADGQIVRVDNTTRRVWIDLGSKDKLRQQITFSVYTQNHRGFGRGPEDIKAKIEVSKITNQNLAECRIIQEDFDRPIQAGDPIYSPLFTPGATEYFTVVGVVDLDGDGKSDHDLLKDILVNAGAEFELIIDDQGNRSPDGRDMTVKSKFLVIGEIPEIDDVAAGDRQDEVQKIQDEHRRLTRKLAPALGIKQVRFQDFLNYIGYENKQNLFVAGETRKFNLRSGSRSTATDEVLGANRASSGQTSERFRTDRGNRGQATSNPQTNRRFSP